MPQNFYITTAIDYTNSAPHIGHAYEKVLTDVLARYHRLKGDRVFFLTGVDQHGQKVKQSAELEGVSPREFAERTTQKFLDLWQKLDVAYDGWASTTDPRHIRAVQRILQALHDRGDLYKAKYGGFYSVRQEQFLTDKERSADGSFGPEWGEVVEIEEENWYFKLEQYRDWLAGFIDSHPEFVTPAYRQTELANAVNKLAGDLSISRPVERLSWGIPLPFDSGYVTYVWFDALINYISFAGYLADDDSTLPGFDELWLEPVHVIGKDIMAPAHGIYWPIMLHAIGFADEDIPRLLVHGFWNMSGTKMSKSSGNVIDPAVLVETYGAEAVRYYLMRDIATGQDADFSEERLQNRYNSDLANDLGNLLNRTLAMAQRYRGGSLRKGGEVSGVVRTPLTELRELVGKCKSTVESRFDSYDVSGALAEIWNLVGKANETVETTAPWKLAKDTAAGESLDAVLYHLAEVLRIVAILINPVLPKASASMLAQLELRNSIALSDASWGGLPDGHRLGAPTPIFPRRELASET